MKKYVCTVCGYIYDEAAGIPDQGILPGTKWADLPDGWTCPLCGASKSQFEEQAEPAAPASKAFRAQQPDAEEMHELSAAQLSALFSNLAKGFEKQYRSEEAQLFSRLAGYYQNQREPAETQTMEALAGLLQHDLKTVFPQASSVASEYADRGALRALVWGEKVTRILDSLLSRYQEQAGALLQDKKVYICEICGFVYIGKTPPDICPVCKVPNMKIKPIEQEEI